MATEDTVARLEGALREAERLEDRCRRGVLRTSEASDQVRALWEAVRGILPEDSDPARLFDRRRREVTDWWVVSGSGYVELRDCENIARLVRAVREILDLLQPESLRDVVRPKGQYFFGAGDVYRATKQVFKIMKRASSELSIVDEYLDDAVFHYIDSLAPAVSVKLLTGTKKPIFPRLLHALERQGAKVEARENTQCHDRFVIVDSQEVWHLGASINRIGETAFMINRVDDEEERSRFLRDFQQWWTQGKQI